MTQVDRIEICPKCKKDKLKIIDKKTWYEERCPYCGFSIGRSQTRKKELEGAFEERKQLELERNKNRTRVISPIKT